MLLYVHAYTHTHSIVNMFYSTAEKNAMILCQLL